MEMAGSLMGFLLHEQGKGVGGAIIHGDGFVPSQEGTVVYLNGGSDLSNVLDRVEDAEGSVVLPKTHITPEVGYIAYFIDSEGNKVGLHSPN